MIFKKIADIVIAHYKKFIAVWIVIFILSGYLAMLSSDIIVYEDTEMAPPDIESAKADEIISEEFQDMPNSTAIVVLTYPDLRSREATDYVLDIEEQVRAGSSEECYNSKKIRCFEDITTIYSVYRSLIRATGASLGSTIYDLETNVTGMAFMMYGLPYIFITVHDGLSSGVDGSAFMVYGIPSSYVQAAEGVNQTSYLLYGVPSMFSQAWDGVNGSAMLLHGVPSMYSQAWDGINGSALMMYGLPSMFADAWDGTNGSALMMYGLPDMFSEAWYGVNSTALMLYGVPHMYGETWAQVNQTAGLIYGGPATYMNTWLSLSMIVDMPTRNQMAFDQSWAVLNSSIDDDAQRQLVHGYHLEFLNIWNISFNSSSQYYMSPTTLPTERAQMVVNVSAPPYFNFTTPVNQTQQFFAGVWSNFNVTNFMDPALLNNYTNTSGWQGFLEQTEGMDIPPEQLAMLQGYYDMFGVQWNLTFYDNATVNISVPERTDHVINITAQPYIDLVSGDNTTMSQMMTGVLQGFDLTTWDDVFYQNQYTDALFLTNMNAMIGDLELSPEMEQQLWAYYDAYYQGWNGSFDNRSLADHTYQERAEATVQAVAPGFIASVVDSGLVDPSVEIMLNAVLANFNLSNWDDIGLVNTVANSTFYGTMQSMIGNFGLEPEMEQQLWAFYDGFYQAWGSSFDNSSLGNDTSKDRAEGAVNTFAPVFIGSVSMQNATAGAMLDGVLHTFNITNWADVSVINGFTATFFNETLNAMIGDMGVPEARLQDMLLYYEILVDEWDGTFYIDATANLSATERSDVAAGSAGLQYISQASGGDPLQEEFLTDILLSFNSSTWDDMTAINQFTDTTFSTQLGYMATDMGVPPSEVAKLERYYELLYVQWNASFNLPPLDDHTSLARAEYAALAAGPGYIDEAAAGNETIRTMMLGVLNGLDMGTWNDTISVNAIAHSMMGATIDGMGADMGLDDVMLQEAKEYLDLFYTSWNASHSIPGMEDVNNTDRAVWAIDESVPTFVSDRPEQEADFIQDIWTGLGLQNWNDTQAQESLANQLAYEGTLEILDDLMLNMTGGSMNQTMEVQVRGYLGEFYMEWNASFVEGSSGYIARGTGSLDRIGTVVDRTAPVHFDFQAPDDDASKFMHDIWRSFGLNNWSDLDIVHNYTISLMYDSMKESSKNAMTFEESFFEDIYQLGKDPTDAEIDAFVENIMRTETLDTYPVQLSDNIVSQFINDKNDTMLIVLGFNRGTGGTYGPIIEKGLKEVKDISLDLKKDMGLGNLKVYISGPAPLSIEMEKTIDEDISRIDIFTAIIVLVLISLFFRSFVTPMIPLISIGAAIVATFGMIFIIGSYFMQVHYTVITLTFTALMGAGIDYCIFIVARYREERLNGSSVEESVRTSVVWAGESITTSGLAVMIGFGGLSVLTFAMVQGMGVILPIGIGIAILVALTFLPALMMVIGDRLFWTPRFMRKRTKKRSKKKVRKKRSRKGYTGPIDDGGDVFYFSSAVNAATKHAKLIVVIAILVSVPTTLIVYTLEPSYDFFSGMPDTEAKGGIDAMAEGFGKSRGYETKVIIDVDQPIYEDGDYDTDLLDAIDMLNGRIEEHSAVKRSDPSTYSEGERIDNVDCWSVFGDEYQGACLQRAIGRSNHTVIITVTLKDEPFSKDSIDSIADIRDLVHTEKKSHPELAGADIVVGGATASMSDIQSLIDDNMQEMRVIVILGIFILLLLVLGSILIPITAIISIGLSISWTLAVTMLVFQFVKGQPILWLMPIILFVVLMGLGMDYNIFIITRMREEVLKGHSDRVAIRRAVERTGGIITACGAIMAGAFGSMMLSVMGLLQQFGFALFFAILIDAFVVRIYLMPAIIVLLRKWNWWAPGRLQRVKRDEKGRLILRGEKGPEKWSKRKPVRKRVREEE